jgi:RNA polymerase sigma-54 factor
MALEIRQNLKLSQQLIITPQLQQSIKLLQLSRMELLEVVQGELLENPVLEEEAEMEETKPQEVKTQEFQEDENAPEKKAEHDNQEVMSVKEGEIKEPNDFDWENYLNTYNAPENIASGLEDLPTYENTLSQRTSLYDHLIWQLHLSNLGEEEEELGATMIGAINDDGYLQDSVEEIAEKAAVPVEKVEAVLEKIQKFDPPGVGARDLRECLLLQIRFFSHEKEALEKLVSNHLSELERKDYRKIAREMKIPIEQVIHLAKLMQELDPKPGRPFSDSSAQYITPDAYCYKVGEEWVVVLNEDGLPKLQVSSFYRNMMQRPDFNKEEAKEYIQTKLRSAIWLIRSIHQRQRTLYKVVKAISKFQRDFFEKGIGHLRPMILRDVAQEIGMHESTVSRVTTNKYVHTPRGIYELKYFFNNGVATSEGDSVASQTIKDKIRQIIGQENPKSPHSDQDIAEMLKETKIDIARRTVAKYREMLGILPSSKRKQLF